MAHHLFGDSPQSELMMVYCQLDSSLKASVDYTITGSDIGPSPSSKYSIQDNVYEGIKCSDGTQFGSTQYYHTHWVRQVTFNIALIEHDNKELVFLWAGLNTGPESPNPTTSAGKWRNNIYIRCIVQLWIR